MSAGADIDLIFQIAGVGIIIAALNILLCKSGREEQSLMITIAGLIIVMLMIVTKISELFDTLRTVFGL